jgi:hypothetical protein
MARSLGPKFTRGKLRAHGKWREGHGVNGGPCQYLEREDGFAQLVTSPPEVQAA